MIDMAKKNTARNAPPPPPPEPEAATPRRYQNVGIRRALHDELSAAAAEDERSVNWMAQRAIREFLDRRRRAKESGG